MARWRALSARLICESAVCCSDWAQWTVWSNPLHVDRLFLSVFCFFFLHLQLFRWDRLNLPSLGFRLSRLTNLVRDTITVFDYTGAKSVSRKHHPSVLNFQGLSGSGTDRCLPPLQPSEWLLSCLPLLPRIHFSGAIMTAHHHVHDPNEELTLIQPQNTRKSVIPLHHSIALSFTRSTSAKTRDGYRWGRSQVSPL